MSRWFRFPNDTINDPRLQRLPGDKFKTWINPLCIASKHDGVLPPPADLAFMLRLTEDKVAALLDEFSEKELLDPVEGKYLSYTPADWASRQYTDGTAADRAKRYRDKKRDANAAVTRDDRDGHRPRKEREERKETVAVTHHDWDAILATYARTGHWSKWAGHPASPACRAPRELLIKHGLPAAGHVAEILPLPGRTA